MRTLPLKRFVDPIRPITYGIVQAGPDFPGGVAYIRPIDMNGHTGVPDVSALRTTTPEIAEQYRRSSVTAGDIVVSIGPSFGKTMVVPRELQGANLTQGTARVAPARDVDRRFLRWALQSKLTGAFWEAAVGGATFHALNLEPLSMTPIPLWPLVAQRAIADYLDAETARIDALITKKRRLVELLDQWEQARILRLVGDWRKVPSVTLRQANTTVVTGPFGTQLSAAEYVDDGVPVINPSHISRGRFMPEVSVSVSEATARRLGRHRLHAGDVVLGRKGDVGRSALVTPRQEGWITGSDSIAIRCDESQLLPEFLSLVLHLRLYRQQLAAQSTGSTLANVNEETLLGQQVPRIGTQAQAACLDQAREVGHSRDALAKRLVRQIDLLVEHRQALITAAVTGDFEVPEAATARVPAQTGVSEGAGQ